MTDGKQHTGAVAGHSMQTEFFEIASAPVHCNVLWPTRAEALAAPAAPIRLVYTHDDGLIFNAAFEEKLTQYHATYENSLHFSPRFREYAEQLADRLIERYEINNQRVIDVGCGDGHFLALLCERGSNHGTGFDPSHNAEHAPSPKSGKMEVLAEYYAAKHADCPVDLLTCRHVLEHIADPLEFLGALRANLEAHGDPIVYFEVPNALYTLRDLGIWDIIYEHRSYFTPPALARLFRRAGFDVLDVAEAYGGQFVGIEARLRGGPISVDANAAGVDDNVRELVERFAAHYESKQGSWRERLAEISDNGRHAVVWGAGSKGVTFLNVVGDDRGTIEHVVDVSPRKHGSFIPCTAQRVIAPLELCELRPECVVLMNSIYRDEVAAMLAELGVNADVISA